MSAFDPATLEETQKLEHEHQLLTVGFSPCGKFVCAGSIDRLLLRWDLETGEKTSFPGHGSWVSALAFHPEGEFLYSVDDWGTLMCRRYEGPPSDPVWRIENAHGGFIRDLAVSPDGRYLITGGADGAVHAWRSENGERVRTFAGDGPQVYSVAVHPGGEGFVSGDQKGHAIQWDFAFGKEVRRIDATLLFSDPYDDGFADVGGVRRMAFSPDGWRLACAGMSEGTSGTHGTGELTILEFDWDSGEQKRKLMPAGGGYMKAVGYLPGGEMISGAEGPHGRPYSSLWIWPPGEETEPLHTLEKVNASRDLDVHPEKPLIALACYEQNGRGGNGRREGEYLSNFGSVTLFGTAPVED